MKIGQLIDIKQNFDNSLKNELLKMDVFFQNHLWDGYSDENDPKFISVEDFDAIQALTDKIEHMVLYIGCPNSVKPMLESICNRKIKYWNNYNTYYNNYKRGKQLKNKNEINLAKRQGEYEWQDDMVIKGHFRWNFKSYILSRRATDLLRLYFESNFKY